MKKIRTGIIFGGFSKEREVSFAGGRTVYDNLNKSLFEAVPIFVDSFGNFVLLNWNFIYKGSIRDFYPPVEYIPPSENHYQVYAESLGPLTRKKQDELILKIGRRLDVAELKETIDFAFFCLHGPYGEDGKIQGLFDYAGIPYSGSGILPSCIGIDKIVQKQLMIRAGFASKNFIVIDRVEWFSSPPGTRKQLFEKAGNEVKFPLVSKSPTQGSSIGINIIPEQDYASFCNCVTRSFFACEIEKKEWDGYSKEQKAEFVRTLSDIREGIGIPVRINGGDLVYHPEELLKTIEIRLSTDSRILIESLDAESQVLVEGFINGREFSCIVIQDENGKPIALPPTEIRKGNTMFDYRSKYLPGMSRKITPIDLPKDRIHLIRKQCQDVYTKLYMGVYARMDGFISEDNTIFLNDINTTSGMMPSSFFFHQAAEIGLNPSQFLTYIIRTSVWQRLAESKNNGTCDRLLKELDELIHHDQKKSNTKIKVAVLLGGYSSERHISVESGRNIYEKLSSSNKYEPTPVFLTGSENNHILYTVPVNSLLKDNADDIGEKLANYKMHEVVGEIIIECSSITKKYSSPGNLLPPKKLSYPDLASLFEFVFIALHGRPGEDGAVQEYLDKLGVPYNGSGVESSRITIDKYLTNELLKKNGFLVADHMLVQEEDWMKDKGAVQKKITEKIKLPFIAKPVDDGCSSAVRKIKSFEEFEAYAKLIFRKEESLDPVASQALHLKLNEEFPAKRVILVEELLTAKGANHFLEITGGMLTRFDEKGSLVYETFEASEALSGGEVLSLEEKFLAGQGQNITPARYAKDPKKRQQISDNIKNIFENVAKLLNIQGYTRIDAFVRIYELSRVEVIFVEVNSLPGMTPATCIFHQSALKGYKPYEFIDRIIEFAFQKKKQPELSGN